jgi:hypothetical protein
MTDEDGIRPARPLADEHQSQRDHDLLGREGQVDGYLDAETSAQARAAQAGRARVLAIILVLLCVLFFTVTIVKIGLQ